MRDEKQLTPAQWARHYFLHDLTAIPIRLDTKIAAIKWRDIYRSVHPHDLSAKFTQPYAIGILGGLCSLGLEVIDFDDPSCFVPFMAEAIKAISSEHVREYPIVRTPSGGYHIYYRTEHLCNVGRLAMTAENKVRIEIRGHGDLVVAPGGVGSEKRTVISGSLDNVPYIHDDERAELFRIARSFHIGGPVRQRETYNPKAQIDREAFLKKYGWVPRLKPWEDFCTTRTWEQVLEPLGWTSSDGLLWKHPNTYNHCSASVNYYGDDRLHIFSTSVAPLEDGRSYSKWQVWVLTQCGGDFAEAVRKYKTQLNDEGGDHAT